MWHQPGSRSLEKPNDPTDEEAQATEMSVTVGPRGHNDNNQNLSSLTSEPVASAQPRGIRACKCAPSGSRWTLILWSHPMVEPPSQ